MKQLATLIFILISLNIYSQNIQPNSFATNVNDILNDIITLNNKDYLLGHQQDLYNNKYRLRYIAIELEGTNFIDTLVLDTFGSDNYYHHNIIINDTLYTLGIEGFYNSLNNNGSPKICVWKRDHNFSIINKTTAQLIDTNFEYLSFFETFLLKDSIIYSFIQTSVYQGLNSYKTYSFKYHIDTDSIEVQLLNDYFLTTDILYRNDEFIAFSTSLNNPISNKDVLIYLDSNYNFKRIDTLDERLYYFIEHVSYDSVYSLVYGKGYVINASYFTAPTILKMNTKIDTLYEIINLPSFTDANVFPRGFIKNSQEDYFASAALLDDYNNSMGIVIYKLDSNLNLIWQKLIPSYFTNSISEVMKIKSNNKGGVFVLFRENDFNNPNNLGYDSYFAEIDSTGNIVTIKDLCNFNNSLTIYPNPTKDYINFSIVNSEHIIKSYQIFNIHGKLIKSEEFKQNKMDVSRLSNGVYILEAKFNDGHCVSKKFIKN